MRICIHRGSHEVGGSSVELECEGSRIVIDLGLPLDADLEDDVALPDVAGLDGTDPSLLALVISHGHPDHCGLADKVHPSVPLHLGAATQRILREAVFFTRGGADLHAAGHLEDRVPLRLGPFTITPYLVDHSAFDAYALLVEAGDGRLLYSGDLRAHGRKAALFERLLREPPVDIDVLLLEGTNIRAAAGPSGLSECDVEERYVELIDVTEGMVLAAYSAQNIDRLVTLFRAAKRSGRLLVLDLYTATIARATGRHTIPQADWDGVRVFIPLSQRIKVKQAREFERVAWLRGHRLYPGDLARRASELVMTFRASMGSELDRAGCLTGAVAVWSLWQGYLDEPASTRLRDWLGTRDIPLTVLHSSGHAGVADLQRFAAAINAKEVVPVHTQQAHRYAELFANARERSDGEWWTA